MALRLLRAFTDIDRKAAANAEKEGVTFEESRERYSMTSWPRFEMTRTLTSSERILSGDRIYTGCLLSSFTDAR